MRFTITNRLISINKTIILLIVMLIALNIKIHAQCISNAPFGTGNAPAAGSTTSLSTCVFGGEYSTITNVPSGTVFTSTSSGGSGNFITIRQGNGTGTLIAQGFSPLVWTSTISGTYAQLINTNGSCGTESACHNSTVSRASACTSASSWGSGTAPLSGNTISLTNCAYGGEYSTINSVAASAQYISSATGGSGNYITIRQNNPTGTIIAQGSSPLTWTSTTAGTYVQIVNTNATCGIDAACHTQTIAAPCAPPSAPGFGSNSWNVLGYNHSSYNYANLSTLAGENFAGYYTDAIIDINSELKWGSNFSPSIASGYIGCTIGNDNHTVLYKRQGFPSSFYQIDLNTHDDGVQCYVNGSLVYQIDGCCADRGIIWSGFLCSTSTVEFRVMEGGGGSNLNVDFIESNPLSTIAGNDATICQGQSVTLGGIISPQNSTPISSSASGNDNTNFTNSVTVTGIPNGSIINSLTFTPTLSYSGSSCFSYNSWYQMQYWNGSNWIALSCGSPVTLTSFNGLNANGFTLMIRVIDLDSWTDYVTIGIQNLSLNYSIPYTYSWAPSASLSSSTILNPISTPTSTTNYTLSVGLSGCTITDQVLITTPNAGTVLSGDNESATCIVNQNGWVHFYHSTGGLIASINSNGQNLGSVTATSFVDGTNALVPACLNIGDPSVMTSVMQRHWIITPSIQPTSPVSVKLPFSDNEYTTLFNAASSNYNGYDDLNNISDIKISKYSGPNVNSSALDNCAVGSTTLIVPSSSGFTNTYSNVTNAQFVNGSIGSFSEFWLHGSSQNSALPSTFNFFTADCFSRTQTQLKWATASESNTDYFNIEKSNDGKVWNKITTVSAAGNSSNTLYYNYLDNSLNTETNYYRLIQFDINGVNDTLSTISSSCDDLADVKPIVYPNPSNGTFTIDFMEEINSNVVTYKLFDIKGNVCTSNTIKVDNSISSISINEFSLKPGIYLLELNYNAKKEKMKIVLI